VTDDGAEMVRSVACDGGGTAAVSSSELVPTMVEVRVRVRVCW
jgi:hypothetical protein